MISDALDRLSKSADISDFTNILDSKNWTNSLDRTLKYLDYGDASSKQSLRNKIIIQSAMNKKLNSVLESQNFLQEVFNGNFRILSDCITRIDSLSRDLIHQTKKISNKRQDITREYWDMLSKEVNQKPILRKQLKKIISTSFQLSEENSKKDDFFYLTKEFFQLRDYQQELIQKLKLKLEKKSEKRYYMQLPTGAGKTQIAMQTIFRLLKEEIIETCLWINAEKPLCEQTIESAKKCFSDSQNPLEKVLVVPFFDSKGKDFLKFNEKEGGKWPKLIVATHDQILNNLSEIEGIDLLVADEVHSGFQSINKIQENVKPKRFLGISATLPYEFNYEYEEIVAEDSFDSKRITIKQHLADRLVLATEFRETWYLRDFLNDDMYDFFKKQKIPFKAYERPEINLGIITKLLEDFENTSDPVQIVYVDSVEQAIILSNTVNLLNENVRSSYISGEDNKDTRQSKIMRFRSGEINCMFAVKLLREGFDNPKINLLYLAQFKKIRESETRFQQMIGRGLRGLNSGGTKDCKITIFDYNLD